MDNALVGKFPPRTLDKVERLLDLLAEIDEHSMLKDKLALHGGTAINLFMLNIPRLSVDIDLSYIGSVEKDVMLADRPTIEQSINEVPDHRATPFPVRKAAMLAGHSYLTTGPNGAQIISRSTASI